MGNKDVWKEIQDESYKQPLTKYSTLGKSD